MMVYNHDKPIYKPIYKPIFHSYVNVYQAGYHQWYDWLFTPKFIQWPMKDWSWLSGLEPLDHVVFSMKNYQHCYGIMLDINW